MSSPSQNANDQSRTGALRCLMVALMVLTTQSIADTQISLRSVVRVNADTPVTLSQIAILKGDNAQRLGDITIIENTQAAPKNASGWIELDLDAVKAALQQQNVRTSTLEMRGATCAILPTSTKAQPQATPTHEPTPQQPAPTTPECGPMHDLVAKAIAQALLVPVQDLRLTYDARDTEFLQTPIDNRAIDVKPAGISDRMPMAITVYEDDRIAQSRTIRVSVLVQRTALIAGRDLRRGDTIDLSDFEPATRWLPPTIRPALAGDTKDRVATRTIARDRVIETHMIEPPIVIKRGELTTIHCVSGSILIEMQRMRARRDAREGETIEFEPADGSRRRRIQARVSGPGQAVIIPSEIGLGE